MLAAIPCFPIRIVRVSTTTLFVLIGSIRITLAAEKQHSSESLTNVTYDQDYDLFYQEPFRILNARAKRDVPRAYRNVISQWGLPDTGGLQHPLTVQIKKIPSTTLRRSVTAYVQSQGNGDHLRQFLVIDIGAYQEHPKEDLEDILTHEMAHVILMDILTAPHAARIPPWFNEGLAQSVTREGRDRVRQDMRESSLAGTPLLLCDLDGPVDEFAHGPFNGSCYPEYYLAVQRLKQLGSRETLGKVIKGLSEGREMTDLVSSLTGKDWPTFKKEIERYSEAVFDGDKPIP